MMKLTLYPALAVGLLALATSTASAAPFTLDDFNNVTSVEQLNNGTTTATVLGSGVAGSRFVTVNVISGGTAVTGAKVTTAGVLTQSIDGAVTANSEIAYGDAGLSPNPALNLDLSSADTFTLLARAEPDLLAPGFVDGELEVNGVAVPIQILELAVGNFGLISVPFSAFPGVDFSDVDSIVIRIAPGAGGTEQEVQLDNFLAIQQIPEPGTGILLLAGLGAAGCARFVLRRRKQMAGA